MTGGPQASWGRRLLSNQAAIASVAALLTLPSLWVGLILDDYWFKSQVRSGATSPFDLFRLVDGIPAHTQKLIDSGILQWWSDSTAKAAFWRPLSSFTHWLDYTLWPNLPPLMHLQSIAWYMLLVLAVGLLYRRMMGETAAGALALLLFCVDDAHATPAAWLAHRNSVLAAVFAALSLSAHHRWRKEARPWAGLAAPMLLLTGLLCKEEGVAVLGYFGAYAAFIEEGSVLKRLSGLAPAFAVVVIWRCLWSARGYGVSDIGIYLDPLRDSVLFAQALPERLVLLLLGLLGTPPVSVTLALTTQSIARLACLAAVYVGALFLAMLPLLRESKAARFWTAGMVLACVPCCATLPDDRLVTIPSIGATALVGLYLARTLRSDRARTRRTFAALAVASLLVFVHLMVAPALLALRSAAPFGPRSLLERFYIAHPLDPEVRSQDLVVVNPPVAAAFMGSPLQWAADGSPMPRHIRVLSSSLFSKVTVSRKDERTIVVAPEYGYLAIEQDRLFRGRRPLTRGTIVRLPGMKARVTRVLPDRRPAEVAFTFDARLEDPSLRWVQWKDGRFIGFRPPPVGEAVVLEGLRGGLPRLISDEGSPGASGRTGRS